MLKHHADARFDSGLAVGDFGFCTVDKYLATIGFVKAIKDGHQRGFARAIFADDPVDCTGHDADGNVFVRLDGAKGF